MRPSRGGHAHATEGTISRFSQGANNAFALRDFDPAYVSSGSRLCENVARYDCTQNFEACGHVQSKKMQKFILRSALRPNQISFLHGLGQNQNPPSTGLCQLPPAPDIAPCKPGYHFVETPVFLCSLASHAAPRLAPLPTLPPKGISAAPNNRATCTADH